MLGYYRYLFATMVATSHIWSNLMWWQGIHGVFCFYVISGYLMCFILRRVYTGAEGAGRYAINRVLRIYPLYWAVLGLGILTRLLVTQVDQEKLTFAVVKIHGLRWPETGFEWISNLSLLLPWDKNALVISQAWSLQVELVFYALMIVLVRRFWIVALWFALSFAFIIYLELNGVPFAQRYATVSGGSIAFSLGALIYFLREKLTLPSWHIPLATVLFLLHLWFAPDIWGFNRTAEGFAYTTAAHHHGIYGAAVLAAYILWAVMSLPKPDQNSSFEKLGKKLGDWSYGIFLIHFIPFIILLKLGLSYDQKLLFLIVALIMTNMMAWGLFHLVEHPINKNWRRKLRPKSV